MKALGAEVYVAAQDVGLCERAAIAAARRKKASIVLMPDGIVFDRVGVDTGFSHFSKELVDGLVARTGRLAGARNRFGQSQPELILSWGPGWSEHWRRAAPSSIVVDVGSPRLDAFGTIDPPPGCGNVLVCSQWLDAAVGRSAAVDELWYRWLDELAADAAAGTHLRVRLHPAEHAAGRAADLADRTQSLISRSTLREDLGWADLVLSPTSTVMLEALAVGRLARCANPGVDDLLDASPFLRELRADAIDLRRQRPTLASVRSELATDASSNASGAPFLVAPGHAAAAAAEALGSLRARPA